MAGPAFLVGDRVSLRTVEEEYVDGEWVDVLRYGLLADEWGDEAARE